MPDSASRQFQIPIDHPCLEGHFPDDPIVPGVVLLDSVRAAVREWKPEHRIKAIPTAKFHRPLYPSEIFTVTLTESSPQSLGFVCHRDHEKLASGVLTLEFIV